MEKIQIDAQWFEGHCIALPKSTLLLIRGRRGVLGCGYFRVETADRTGDALAVVTGVKSCAEMLTAEVRQVSAAAAALGVRPGMSGREALLRMG